MNNPPRGHGVRLTTPCPLGELFTALNHGSCLLTQDHPFPFKVRPGFERGANGCVWGLGGQGSFVLPGAGTEADTASGNPHSGSHDALGTDPPVASWEPVLDVETGDTVSWKKVWKTRKPESLGLALAVREDSEDEDSSTGPPKGFLDEKDVEQVGGVGRQQQGPAVGARAAARRATALWQARKLQIPAEMEIDELVARKLGFVTVVGDARGEASGDTKQPAPGEASGDTKEVRNSSCMRTFSNGGGRTTSRALCHDSVVFRAEKLGLGAITHGSSNSCPGRTSSRNDNITKKDHDAGVCSAQQAEDPHAQVKAQKLKLKIVPRWLRTQPQRVKDIPSVAAAKKVAAAPVHLNDQLASCPTPARRSMEHAATTPDLATTPFATSPDGLGTPELIDAHFDMNNSVLDESVFGICDEGMHVTPGGTAFYEQSGRTGGELRSSPQNHGGMADDVDMADPGAERVRRGI